MIRRNENSGKQQSAQNKNDNNTNQMAPPKILIEKTKNVIVPIQHCGDLSKAMTLISSEIVKQNESGNIFKQSIQINSMENIIVFESLRAL